MYNVILETSLRRYTFGIFCDFFPVYFDALMKDRLKIKDAERFVAPTKVSAPKRRKSGCDEIDENVSVKVVLFYKMKKISIFFYLL